MRNTLLHGFSQIRHSLSATGREIHPRAVNLFDSAEFVRTCVTLDKTCSDMFFTISLKMQMLFMIFVSVDHDHYQGQRLFLKV